MVNGVHLVCAYRVYDRLPVSNVEFRDRPGREYLDILLVQSMAGRNDVLVTETAAQNWRKLSADLPECACNEYLRHELRLCANAVCLLSVTKIAVIEADSLRSVSGMRILST